MSHKDHWEQVYIERPAHELGWYKSHLRTSLNWIGDLGLAVDDPIIDVGGGASTLVDDLLEAGYRSITVLDISGKALTWAKARLGDRAESVTWLEGDVTSIELPSDYYQLWHDRAVFHFLTSPEEQTRYRNKLLSCLNSGGHLIIGTFALEAPPTCSGLPVRRYSPEQLENKLGDRFELMRQHKELHVTPGGVEQMYLYCHFRRKIR
jgi:SAM-dependent methyltransferase